jgi:hypothetical protein
MKKTLLIAVAAMFVAMGANAQFKRVSQATKFVPQATKVVPQAAPVMMKQAPMDQTEQLVATHVKPVANHRAAADLEGTYILDYANWDGDFTASSTFTITAETGKAKTFGENEAEEEIEVEFDYNLRLDNFTYEGAKVYAFFDEENNTITIPVQAAGTYSPSYPDYRTGGLVTVNGEPYNYGFDIVLVVEEDGTLYNYDFAEELAEAGWPEGSALTGFWTYLPGLGYLAYGTTMEFYVPNASMRDNEVHIENGSWGNWTWTTRPVFVEDFDTEYVVHNFFGLCPISIAVDGDKAGIATPVRVEDHDYADEGEDPNYIQIWQWNEELDDRVNPGLITGNIVEEDGVKYIEFYDTEYKEAWTDPDGTEHEAGNYYIKDYTKWFMVHSTYGDTGAYWWGEARYALIALPLETTGITEMKNDGRQLTTSKTYNLLGQEVTPATKGLVIKDGRKVVVK